MTGESRLVNCGRDDADESGSGGRKSELLRQDMELSNRDVKQHHKTVFRSTLRLDIPTQ